MIYTSEGHPISQEQIVFQNFGALVNQPGGDFLEFEERLNRDYTDQNHRVFTSAATLISTPEDAADALDGNVPILYTTTHHATVQTALVFQKAPGGPVVVRGGTLWDPGTGAVRQLSAGDVATYTAAWSITTHVSND